MGSTSEGCVNNNTRGSSEIYIGTVWLGVITYCCGVWVARNVFREDENRWLDWMDGFKTIKKTIVLISHFLGVTQKNIIVSYYAHWKTKFLGWEGRPISIILQCCTFKRFRGTWYKLCTVNFSGYKKWHIFRFEVHATKFHPKTWSRYVVHNITANNLLAGMKKNCSCIFWKYQLDFLKNSWFFWNMIIFDIWHIPLTMITEQDYERL